MQIQQAQWSIYVYIPAVAFKELVSRPIKPQISSLICLSFHLNCGFEGFLFGYFPARFFFQCLMKNWVTLREGVGCQQVMTLNKWDVAGSYFFSQLKKF